MCRATCQNIICTRYICLNENNFNHSILRKLVNFGSLQHFVNVWCVIDKNINYIPLSALLISPVINENSNMVC